MKTDPLLLNQPHQVYNLIKALPASAYIDPLGLSAASIEAFCTRQWFSMDNKRKDPFVEKQCRPPLLAAAFYYYLYHHETLPSQEAFRTFYRTIHADWHAATIGETYADAFDARLDRFYASIMRDVHFYHLAKDLLARPVSFTLQADIEQKADLLIPDGPRAPFGVQLRVATRDSLAYSLMKEHRAPAPLRGIRLIDFPLSLSKAKKVATRKDAFFFYQEADIRLLQQLLLS